MNRQTQFEKVNEQQAGAGINLDDILFLIFRHKILLLSCLFLGLVGAVAVRINRPLYSSQAELLVRYVVDTRDINPVDRADVSIRGGDSSGESVLNSEKAILTSQDLAREVVRSVGAEKILAAKGRDTSVVEAANVVSSGLKAETLGRSDVIVVYFEHPDPKITQPVLDALIQAYLRKHIEVRQGMLFGQEHYSEELAKVRTRLSTTEAELRRILTEAKVISIAEAKRTYNTQTEKLRGELLAAKAELSTRKAILGEEVIPAKDGASESSIPTDKLDYYATVLAGLDALTKKERELLVVQNYTSEHPLVIAAREGIAKLKQTRAELEREYPGLVLSENTSTVGFDVTTERAQIRALSAKVEGYENLLTNLQGEAFNLLTIEPKIAELERQRDQEIKNLDYVSSSLDKARAEEVGGDKVTGINVVEKPTPPKLNSKKTQKMMMAVFAGILGLGFGIAALLEFVLDRTIKRSVDVRRHIQLPLLLTIPNTELNGNGHSQKLLLNKGHANQPEIENGANGAMTTIASPPTLNGNLRSYAEGLCERLITYFEANGLIHKPKLVGVTSCGRGAGVTTLASGMAAALSKTGDGNVLLVDMNIGPNAIHSFHKGQPGCGLSEALEPGRRAEAKIEGNLYHVSLRHSDATGVAVSDEETAGRLLPARLKNIMPKLKASDYDFIIFDLPPVSPTSVTPRLASNMDMVLLVLESGKTAQQPANQATMLLNEAHANVAVVLNKYRKHVPAMLSQEL